MRCKVFNLGGVIDALAKHLKHAAQVSGVTKNLEKSIDRAQPQLFTHKSLLLKTRRAINFLSKFFSLTASTSPNKLRTSLRETLLRAFLFAACGDRAQVVSQ